MAIFTLIVLVIAIIIGATRNTNTGLVSIFFAFIVGTFFMGLTGKEIILGWPVSLFFMLLGMTLLFGIANVNGTLRLLSRKVILLTGGRTKLLPITFFVITGIISAFGAGGIVAVALMAPIAMTLAKSEGIPEILTGTMVISGTLAGGLSPLCATGIVINSLAVEHGMVAHRPLFLTLLSISLVMGSMFYFIFGGHKLKNKGSENIDLKDTEAFNSAQKITLLVLLAVLIGILLFRFDVGLSAFSGASILLFLRVADEKKAIATVPWSTLLLVCGVALFVNVVTVAGGIDVLSNFLAGLMTTSTASGIMAVIGGLMSAVSSALGVVAPTMIPTVTNIAGQTGANPISILAGLAVGACIVTFSPLSTLGAMVLASSKDEANKEKLFRQLLITAVFGVVFAGILGLLGVYDIFA